MDRGWICLYRSILDCEIWEEKPFDKRSAWIDLLLRVNHSDKKILLGNVMIPVKRGELITSEKKLMERWGWGKTKTRAFLLLLENEKMIVKKSDSKKTSITIVNYCKYQDLKTTDDTATRPSSDCHQTVARPSSDTNNNDNNDNNDNKENIYISNPAKMPRHKYGSYKNVLLSDNDLSKLKEEFPGDWEQRIERLSEYMKSSGKSYKDHLATIRSWARKDKPKMAWQQKQYIVNGTRMTGEERLKYEHDKWEGVTGL